MNPKAILFPTENPIEIKHALLYWDELLIPKVFLVDAEGKKLIKGVTFHYSGQAQADREENLDFRFLIQENILERPEIVVASHVPRELRRAFVESELNACLVHPEIQDSLINSASTKLNAIEMSLYSSLPTPGDVPFQEILEFKHQRRDVLEQFRITMGEVYLEIIDSNDIPRSKSTALARLERSLVDLNAAANERWYSKLLSTMKVELNLPNIMVNSLAGISVSSSFGLPPELGAGVGAVAGLLKFEVVSRDISKNEISDYEYIYDIYKHKSQLKIT